MVFSFWHVMFASELWWPIGRMDSFRCTISCWRISTNFLKPIVLWGEGRRESRNRSDLTDVESIATGKTTVDWTPSRNRLLVLWQKSDFSQNHWACQSSKPVGKSQKLQFSSTLTSLKLALTLLGVLNKLTACKLYRCVRYKEGIKFSRTNQSTRNRIVL